MRIRTKHFEVSLCDSFAGIREGYYWDGEHGHEFTIDCGLLTSFVPSEVLAALREAGLLYNE